MRRKSHVRFGRGPTEKCFWQPEELASGLPYYITEMDPETGQCFGLVEGFERELGYFDLTELAETTVFGGVPAVERDLYWQSNSRAVVSIANSWTLAGRPDSWRRYADKWLARFAISGLFRVTEPGPPVGGPPLSLTNSSNKARYFSGTLSLVGAGVRAIIVSLLLGFVPGIKEPAPADSNPVR